mmetsp:Transcript_33521/g.70278  ORF Transcript_33521/g.70278 Transcript_33521/m.70278 type:complete len:176 (+) Transcript_33521:1214-1741(+)
MNERIIKALNDLKSDVGFTSSPTPSAQQVENFVLDANLTKKAATSKLLVQDNNKPIQPGFGRPCTRSVARVQSYIIPPAYIPFEQENELDPPISIIKHREGHHDPLAPLTFENNQIPKTGKLSRVRHPTTAEDLDQDNMVQDKITTDSLSHCSDKVSSPKEPPELVSSSEDDDGM